MKILHVISSINPATGGPSAALLGLTTVEVGLGIDVHVLTLHRPNEVTSETLLNHVGVKVHLIESGPHIPRDLYRSISDIFELVQSAELLHIHGVWEFLPTVAMFAARRLRVPYVVRPCGMLDSWSLGQNRMQKRLHMAIITRALLRHSALIHATTERESSEIAKLNLQSDVSVVFNGVDDAAFTASPPYSFAVPDLGRGKRILLFLGRVNPKKGLDILLPALSKVQTQNVLLLIVGPQDKQYVQGIREQIQSLNIQDRVRIAEPVYGPDRFALYALAEVFVLPSKQENFGITVAEAMAMSVPVVVSPEVALSDVVRSSGAGLVVPRDSMALAAALDYVLCDRDFREKCARSGRRAAESYFCWAEIGPQWNSIYRKLITEKTKAGHFR